MSNNYTNVHLFTVFGLMVSASSPVVAIPVENTKLPVNAQKISSGELSFSEIHNFKIVKIGKSFSPYQVKLAKKSHDSILEFFQSLANNQVVLGREFDDALIDNLWDMYES